MSIFGVILVRIFPHLDWIPRDTDTFHAVLGIGVSLNVYLAQFAKNVIQKCFWNRGASEKVGKIMKDICKSVHVLIHFQVTGLQLNKNGDLQIHF